MTRIKIENLSRAGFAEFGDVVQLAGSFSKTINQGFAHRFDNLAGIDVTAENGETNFSLFTANPRPTPIEVKLMERHPLGSQLFYPLQNKPWMVLVCADPKDVSSYRAFRASGIQGVNYARNVWHHPLLVHDVESRFAVVDRKGLGHNLEEYHLPVALFLE